MKDLFQTCNAKNNEEYRAVLKRRAILMVLLILAGVLTAGLALFGYFSGRIQTAAYQFGFLTGLGFGFGLGAAIALIQILKKLADEEKLKEARLKETDEREVEVNNRALRATAKILLGVMYVCLVVGGITAQHQVIEVCWILIAAFLLSYEALKKYYGRKL